MNTIMLRKPPARCASCAYRLAAILHSADDRCAYRHRVEGASEMVAYPTVEWMRSPAGACGPDGVLFDPLPPPSPTPPRAPARHAWVDALAEAA